MTELDCENVCIAAMAIADGYRPYLSSQGIEAHLANCTDCRREVRQLRELSSLLDTQQRRQPTENIWRRIERRLPDSSGVQSTSQTFYPFLLLGVLMLGYRLIQIIPDRDFGFFFKLGPILFVIAAFSYLRENPFKINSELRLAGE